MEAQLEKMWVEMDADGSGALEPEELRQVLAKMGTKLNDRKLARLMREIDRDGDGSVDLDEFRLWWKQQSEKSRDRFAAAQEAEQRRCAVAARDT